MRSDTLALTPTNSRKVTLLALVLSLLLTGLIASGLQRYLFLQLEERAMADVATIAQEKRNTLQALFNERLQDLHAFSAYPFVVAAAQQLGQDSSAPEHAALQNSLGALATSYGYSAAIVFDASGKKVLAGWHDDTDEHPHLPYGQESTAPTTFPAAGHIVTFGEDEGDHRLNLYAPIRSETGETVGILRLHGHLNMMFGPAIASWPSSFSSGKTMLLQRRNSGVTVLVLHGDPAHTERHYALDQNRLLPVQVAMGKHGTLIGDHGDGHTVVATAAMIEGTPLHLMVSIDESELQAMAHNYWLILLPFALVISVLLTALTQQLLTRNERLRQNEKKYRDLLEMTGTGFTVVTPTGELLEGNESYARMLGFDTRDALFGRNILEFVAPWEQERAKQTMGTVLATGSATREEFDHTRPDGCDVVLEVNAFVEGNGKDARFYALLHDVTERKQHEQHLARQNHSLLQLSTHDYDIELGLSPLFSLITQYAAEGIQASAVSIGMRNPQSGQVECVDSYDAESGNHERRKPLGYLHCDYLLDTLKEKAILPIEDTRQTPFVNLQRLTEEDEQQLGALLACGIWNGNNMVGALLFEQYGRARHWSLEEINFAHSVVNFAAMAIERDNRQKSEARFRDIAFSSGDFIWEVDAQGVYTYASGATEAILGLSAEQVVGKTPFDLMPADEAQRVGAIFAGIVAGPHPIIDLENWNISADGQRVCLLTNGVPILDTEGKLLGYRGVDKDITQRKQHELEMQLLRQALDTSMDGFYLMDESGRFLDVNEGACKSLGYSREELLQMRVIDIDPDVDQELWAIMWQRVREETTRQLESQHRRKNGEIFPVEISASYFEQDGKGWVQTIVRDISERRAAEQRLQEAEESQRRLLQSVLEGIIGTDAEGRINFVNPATEKLLGFPQNELLGLSLHETLHRGSGDQLVQRDCPLCQTLTDRAVHVTEKGILHDRDGAKIPVEYTSVPTYQEGRFVGTVAVFRDISELVRARDEAQASSRAKSDFLANISHELRTPMGAIIGMTQLALESEDLGNKPRDQIRKAHNSAISLLGLLNDILDFSKIEAGKLEFERVPFRLADELEALSSLLGSSARDKGLELNIHLSRSLPGTLIGDPLRLRQVLTNLIGNAIKFTPQGSVQVNITSIGDNPRAHGVCLQFEVIDTGIGMSAEQRRQLFQAFSQGDASISRKYGGTGLGLIISQRLVEMMGGEIHIDSQEGRGSTFTVTAWFELGSLGEQQDAQGDPLELPQLAGLQILLVEDNPLNQELAEEFLNIAGANCQIANNGQEALERLQQQPELFDAILMDIQMPVMDGYAATRAIRQQSRFDTIPIIAMTAHAMADDRQRSIEAGMQDYVTKPIDVRQLYAVLQRQCKR